MCAYLRGLSWLQCRDTLGVMNMDIDGLLQLERKVWDALADGDPEADTECSPITTGVNSQVAARRCLGRRL
jgi:hypothetical protein